MPDLTTLPAILPNYPFWVRSLMFGFALGWILLYAVLMFLSPAPPKAPVPAISLDRFEQAQLDRAPGSLTFDLTVTNNTGKVVTLTGAEIIYFQDEIETSGLQGS